MLMKIVSWNCRGKFREKYPLLKELKADIYVVQECENPEKYPEICDGLDMHYYWCGESNNKGLGVFLNPSITSVPNDWKSYCLRNFISLRINDKFNLLGV